MRTRIDQRSVKNVGESPADAPEWELAMKPIMKPISRVEQKMKRSWILGGLLLCLFSNPAEACTIVSGTTNGGVHWAGNNEDLYFDFDTGLNVHPATDELFGAVSFTYEPTGTIQGGFNERGLFFDFNAVPKGISEGMQVDLGQQASFAGTRRDAQMHMLQKTSTVQEVIDFLKTYEMNGFDFAQLHVADREGRRAIINASGVQQSGDSFLLSTNFNVFEPSEAETCWRFQAVQEVFKQPVSEQTVREALIAATMDTRLQNELTGTIYSNVINISTGDATNYFGGDFSHSYQFNLQELLAKGEQSYRWVDLFPDHPLTRVWQAYETGGTEAALELYDELESTLPVEERRELLRHVFSALLFADHQYADAKVIFERWLAIVDETDQSRHLLHGIVLLTNGDVEGAREMFARQVEFERAYNLDSEERDAGALAPITAKWISRLNGAKPPNANAKFVLKGYRDAKFVTVDRGDFLPLANFLRRTDDGWEGDFVLQPGKNPYIFIVDGREVADPSNPELFEIVTRTGTRKMNVREQ